MSSTINGHVSHWFTELPSPRPALPGDRDADVCIVGAGYTGLWTAYYLLKADPSLRITVLEERFAGFGASGRNGGWLSGLAPGHRGLLAKRHGRAAVIADSIARQAEFFSFYATVLNRIAYASLEDPKIDDAGTVSFDILWCPHQDHYKAFDCRIQRYFVRGMLAAAHEHSLGRGWQVRFDSTIPAGAQTCHFTMWDASDEERRAWDGYSQLLEAKALTRLPAIPG